MKSYTAGYVLSKHLAALKRQINLPGEEDILRRKWQQAYENTFPLLTDKQREIALSEPKNWLINAVIWLNEWFLPGDHNHLLCRKYYIRKWVEEAITKQEIDHLVILGAGLDPLVYTLDKLPAKISFVEHPDMIDGCELLHQNLTRTSQLFYHGIDLNDVKKTATFFQDLRQKTDKYLFVTEGVLDYLIPKAAHLVIKQIDQMLEFEHNEWIGTLFCLKEMPKHESWVFQKAIEAVGESIQWQYKKDDFIGLLSGGLTEKIQLQTHSQLIRNTELNIEMNRNLMNGFYLFRC